MGILKCAIWIQWFKLTPFLSLPHKDRDSVLGFFFFLSGQYIKLETSNF